MNSYDRRAILDRVTADLRGKACGNCRRPLVARLIGAERLEIEVVCEAQECWPYLSREWRREIEIMGLMRESGRAHNAVQAKKHQVVWR